jgi:hypothetical protein
MCEIKSNAIKVEVTLVKVLQDLSCRYRKSNKRVLVNQTLFSNDFKKNKFNNC